MNKLFDIKIKKIKTGISHKIRLQLETNLDFDYALTSI